MKKKQLTTFSKVCIFLVCVLLFILFVTGVATRGFCQSIVWFGEKYNNTQTKCLFNTSALNQWCGEPTGQVRMVGATAQERLLIDEMGNIWSVDAELKENGFYLLWIDSMRTEETKDDEVLKIWEEK